MSEEASKRPPEPPKDYVTPAQRVDVDQHVSKITTALEKPTSVLLFVIILMGIVVGGSVYDTKTRSEILASMMASIEDHRAEEVSSCQTTLRQLIGQIGHRRTYEVLERGQSE